MTTKPTRRDVAVTLAASVTALAQTPAAQPPLPANPDEEFKAALATLRDNSDQLAKFPLPMSVEPAAHFKA